MVSLRWLQGFDAFSKVEDQHLKKSQSGGIVSVIIVLLSFILLANELKMALLVTRQYTYSIDPTVAAQFLINLDITVATRCNGLKVDLVDLSRTATPLSEILKLEDTAMSIQSNIRNHKENFKSIRQLIHLSGKKTFSLFPEKNEGGSQKEGCRIHGSIPANKLQGILQIGAINHHQQTNFTHQIDRLSFGIDFPGISNPLDSTYDVALTNHMMYQYFVSLVPTVYVDLDNNALVTNQYAVTEHKREVNHDAGSHGIPGISFKYEIEPIMVTIRERQQSVLHTFTRLCGLVGGVYVTAGLLHRLLNLAFQSLTPKS